MVAVLQFPTPKQVGSTIIYRVSFARWLAPIENDILTSATLTVTPDEVTTSALVVTDDSVIFTVDAGGTAGQLYRIDIAFTTQEGQGDTKSVFLRMAA